MTEIELTRRAVKGMNRGTKPRVAPLGFLIFVVSIAGGVTSAILLEHPILILAGVLIGLYFLLAIKIAMQWEKVALMRLGKYIGLRGPGLFMVIPFIDEISQYVDQRVRVTDVRAESALTRDTVPVNVDAIVFWVVWNAEKTLLEVSDFTSAITLSAQTALRESIGRHELAQMITERDTLGHELQRILDEKTNPWGITVQSVEIRDVHIPEAPTTSTTAASPQTGSSAQRARVSRPRCALFDHTRVTIAAQAVGIAQGALDFAKAYAKERKQFGRPIAEFQGLQFMLADMAMKLEAARQLTYAAACKSERGDSDLTFFGAAAKCFASDAAMEITTDAVQVLGGYGYVKDYPVERMMRDAKITQIYEGTNQIQRLVMARQILK